LIEEHTRGLLPKPYLMRRAVADLGVDGVRQLIAIKRADIQAHNEILEKDPLTIFDDMERELDRILAQEECCSLKQLAVTGKEVIALGAKGRSVGDILDALLELVLKYPEQNEKTYLLAQAEKMVNEA
jgi:tRNA nucleotidyltransferase (CCA-adding enzyme)